MRRDEWNKNDFFREQSGSAKPFFEVNIGGYSIGGPVIIPKRHRQPHEPEEGLLLPVAGVHRRHPADGRLPHEHADRRSSARATSRRRYIGKATLNADGSISGRANSLQPIIDPADAAAVPRQRDPAEPDQPDRSEHHQPAEPAEQRSRPDERTRTTTRTTRRDTTPLHTRTNFVVARRHRAGARTPGSASRALFDRDDSITYNVVQPGEASSNNVFPGDLVTGTMTKVISPTMVNEVTVGLQPQPLRLPRSARAR